MRIIHRGLQIGQAVKNVQRLRQIISVFAKYGFVDIVERMRLEKFLPSRLKAFTVSQAEKSIPERMRYAFEELGPTFVKFGQLLSTRPDILPENFIQEFVKLQDTVGPLPFEVVKIAVEKELGKTLEEAFYSFDPKPLAAASIGQVHLAVLPRGDGPGPRAPGEKVVVKVQRPEIARIIDNDISLMSFLAGLLEKYVPETKIMNPKVFVDEFFRTLSYELDFVVEANNIARIAENLKSMPDIVIPKVYKSHSTARVLTLERLEGIKMNDLPALKRAGVNTKYVVELGARTFFKTVMLDGVFHGDLHGGNVFVLPQPTGNAKIGLIDFGIVGRLSDRSRHQLATMVMAIISQDFENLCYTYAELGASSYSIDMDAFEREVRNTLAPYMGLSLREVNAGKVLIEATRIAAKYQIQVPGDWMIVFKALFTMEGMGRTLDPDFDMIALGESLIKDLVADQYSPARLSKELLWIAKDSAALLRILPRHLKGMLKRFAANDYALELKIPELEPLRDQLDLNGRRQSLSTLAVGLFIAGSLSLQFQQDPVFLGLPWLALIFFGMGGFTLFALWIKSFK